MTSAIRAFLHHLAALSGALIVEYIVLAFAEARSVGMI